ncbi:Hypothetical protein D9617_3g020500 [Elsinoe fawcettii]|nr:Hypothetical protein D9617_3g020500 [Elsinoe fawcettii]
MAAIKSEAPSANKPTPPKDLINLRNLKNGEVYRFSCRTCIDGHRAPLCDPKKHRGKVMYRRPNPGRPARQCGHPKSVQCDCLAKRTLCCTLSSDEWDEVTDGKVVTVAMYDSLEDLETAQGKIRTTAPSPGSSASPARGSSSIPSAMPTPPATRFQMFGVGGPHGNVEPSADPFAWSGTAPIMNAQQHSPIDVPSPTNMQNVHTFQTMPPPGSDHARPQPQVQAQFGQFQVTLPPVHTPGSVTSEPYGSYAARTPSSSVSYPLHDPGTPLDHHVVALQRQLSSNLDISQIHPAIQSHYTNGMTPRTMSIEHSAFSPPIMTPESMHIDVTLPGMAETIAAPATRPSQSCCSKKSKQPQQMQMFDSYMYPGSAPSQQFPCPSCASTLCTCSNCPSTMQSFEYGGAWAQACGRTGHLESPFPNGFSFPVVEMQPPPSIPQEHHAQPTTSAQDHQSCCSGRTTVHQPVDSFTTVPPMMHHGEWQGQQAYQDHLIPVTSSMEQHTLNPALLHEDQMMWQ